MIANPLRHINRHRQMIGLLYKYGTSDLIQNSGLAEHFSKGDDPTGHSPKGNGRATSHDWTSSSRGVAVKEEKYAGPEQLADDLESMGPAFIKLGQLLSTRSDILPESYREALARLQDNAEPIDTADVFRIIEEELGEQPEYLFASFDPKPLATASLGQVHRAKMKSGEQVVVKVQRPGVAQDLQNDIEAMEELATFCESMKIGRQYQFNHLVQSLKDSLSMELDYEREAANALSLHRNLDEFPAILIPQPVLSHSTSRVITMRYIEFEKLTELPASRLDADESKRLAEVLFKSFLYQVLVHGSFHADPHPGNIGLTVDNRLAWMDHGLVVDVPPALQTSLIKLLLAITEGDGSQAAVIAESTGVKGQNYHSQKFKQEIESIVARNVNRDINQIDSSIALMQIQKAAGQHDLLLPQEVILLGRALMHLERVVAALDAEFDPNQAIQQYSMQIMREYSGQKLTLSNLYQSFLESTEFIQNLPARANQLAELVTTNGLEIKVNALDETKFISGLHKVANRISTGLIISAMIVAAALMMRLKTDWMILGYPAIAFMFFSLAAIAGGVLVWRVLISDRFEA